MPSFLEAETSKITHVMRIWNGLLSKKHILLIVSAPGGRSQENGSHEFISRASSEEHHPIGEDPTLEA